MKKKKKETTVDDLKEKSSYEEMKRNAYDKNGGGYSDPESWACLKTKT